MARRRSWSWRRSASSRTSTSTSTLERVLVAARELTGARYAAIGVLDEERTGLARFITAGLDEEATRAIGPPPRGRGVLGELIAHPVPLRLPEVGGHPRSFGFPAGHPTMHSFLGVPVLAGGEPYGNLYLTDKAGGAQFSAEDERALTLLADFAGVAIDHARRYAGSETERRRAGADRRGARTRPCRSRWRWRAERGWRDVGVGRRARPRARVGAPALAIEVLDGDELVVAAAVGEVPDRTCRDRACRCATRSPRRALRRWPPQRLEDAGERGALPRAGLGRLGFSASAGLAVPLVFRGERLRRPGSLDRRDGEEFSDDDVAVDGVVRGERGDRGRDRAETRRPSSGGCGSRRPRPSARAGRGSCTTRRCSRWPRCGSGWRRRGARRGGDPAALDALLAEALGQLDGEIATLRALITELRPAALDELGLAAAIGALAERSASSRARRRPRCRRRRRRRPPTPTGRSRSTGSSRRRCPTRASTAARGARSRPSRSRGGRVELSVRDDGSGFDPARATAGFGVLGMRERAELLGGRSPSRPPRARARRSRRRSRSPSRRWGGSSAASTLVPSGARRRSWRPSWRRCRPCPSS